MKYNLTTFSKGVFLAGTLAALAFIIAPRAFAAEWYVNSTATSTGNGMSTTTPFMSISEAVATSTDGDIINIAAGTYSQGSSEIIVDKSLTFRGPNNGINPNNGSRTDEAVINGSASGSAATFNITSGSANVIFEGLKFENMGASIRSDAAGAAIVLNNNIFTGSMTDGIFFDDPNLTISNNLFTDIATPASDVIQVGVSTSPGTGGISITGNTFQNITESGALNLSGVNGEISGNTFSSVEYYGILVANKSGNLTISSNTFDNITNPDPATSDTWGAGIRTYNEGGIPENDYTGPIAINSNTFSNSYLGIGVRPGSNVEQITTDKNKFDLSNTAHINNSGTSTLNMAHNWWGTADQATFEPKIMGDVLFDPWYTDEALTTLSNAPAPEPEEEESSSAPTPSGHRRSISTTSSAGGAATILPPVTNGEVLGAETVSPEIQAQINAIKAQLIVLIRQLIEALQAQIRAQS